MNFQIVEVPPIRISNQKKKYVNDVDSRLPKGHQFKDPNSVTFCHEGCHGVNSRLRNQYSQSLGKINCLYMLDGKAVICPEPSITLSQVAKVVPKELQGNIFKLYLVSQQRYWNDRSLYLFDEWSAYQAGCMNRIEEQLEERSDSILSMIEMCVYCGFLCMLQETNTDLYQAYNALVVKTKMIYDVSKGKSIADEYLDKLKNTSVYYYIGRHGTWFDKGIDF